MLFYEAITKRLIALHVSNIMHVWAIYLPNKRNQRGHFSAVFLLCQKSLAQQKHCYKMPVIASVICFNLDMVPLYGTIEQ